MAVYYLLPQQHLLGGHKVCTCCPLKKFLALDGRSKDGKAQEGKSKYGGLKPVCHRSPSFEAWLASIPHFVTGCLKTRASLTGSFRLTLLHKRRSSQCPAPVKEKAYVLCQPL